MTRTINLNDYDNPTVSGQFLTPGWYLTRVNSVEEYSYGDTEGLKVEFVEPETGRISRTQFNFENNKSMGRLKMLCQAAGLSSQQTAKFVPIMLIGREVSIKVSPDKKNPQYTCIWEYAAPSEAVTPVAQTEPPF